MSGVRRRGGKIAGGAGCTAVSVAAGAVALAVLPRVTPRRVSGPVRFFLSAMSMDMVGEPHGSRRLIDHFEAEAQGART